MNGGIFCNKDGAKMSGKTDDAKKLTRGTCPKCGRTECHIFVKGARYYRDVNDKFFTYVSALSQLAAMNREIEAKTFDVKAWLPGAIKTRKLKNAIQKYISEIKLSADNHKKSMNTYWACLSRVNIHILHETYGLGEMDIEDITTLRLKQFLKSLPKHLKIHSIRGIMRVFRSFFSWAVDEGLLANIPIFPRIEGEYEEDVKEDENIDTEYVLDVQGMEEVLKRLPAMHQDIFEFAMKSGTRPGETCALQIRDINFKEKTMIVRRTFARKLLQESDKARHSRKKGKKLAIVPLLPRTLEILKKHIAGREANPFDFVFVNPVAKVHTNYTINYLSRTWNKYAGVPMKHYYGTRHSFATWAVETVGIDAAQGLLRHATRSSTEIYSHSHTRLKYLRDAVAKMGEVVELNKIREQKEKVG